MRTIPFHKASLGREEERAVCAVLRSGWITKGPRPQEFEQAFARYVGAKHALGLNSCTAGLHIALCALGIGKGDVVITSPVTFAATANVVMHTGADVCFVDIDPRTGNMDPVAVQRALSSRVRAIIAVHLAGNPCDMGALSRMCKMRRIPLIEDAAHALGAMYKGMPVGLLGDVAAFSFYATKNITTGEGGMVTTQNARLAERMRILSLHGLSADAWKRYTPQGRVYYDVLCAGFKYNMFDIQAALGMVQLKKFPAFMQRRNRLWKIYHDRLQQVPEINVLMGTPDSTHAQHLFIVTINEKMLTITRDGILDALRARGVYGQIHFRSLHEHKYYKQKYGFKRTDLPYAHTYSATCISLPLYPLLTSDDVHYVCDCLVNILHKHRKRV